MKNFNLIHAKALYVRFCAIYGDKFYKIYHDEDFKSIWYNEWCEGLNGIEVQVIKEAIEYCKLNLEWSPSIAEFRHLCERLLGLPSMSEAMTKAIRKDFSHPVIQMAYESIGSWDMSHLKESELTKRFINAYQEALDNFRNKGLRKQIEEQSAMDSTKE